jgi:hypothetical protein
MKGLMAGLLCWMARKDGAAAKQDTGLHIEGQTATPATKPSARLQRAGRHCRSVPPGGSGAAPTPWCTFNGRAWQHPCGEQVSPVKRACLTDPRHQHLRILDTRRRRERIPQGAVLSEARRARSSVASHTVWHAKIKYEDQIRRLKAKIIEDQRLFEHDSWGAGDPLRPPVPARTAP